MASLTSTVSGGLGGHYNSVRDLRQSFLMAWPESEVHVLTIGNIQPVVFRNAGEGVHHVDTSTKSFHQIRHAVRAIAETFGATHVHAFDNKSFAFAGDVARNLGALLYLTRPGGPNPTRYFPAASDIICFSQENADYLSGKRKYRNSRIHVIPQRVIEPSWDDVRIAELCELANGKPILLRIARLTELNRPSVEQAISLSTLLHSRGVEHVLAIIGTPNESDLVDETRAKIREEDLLLTNERFTRRAEQLTIAARGVVGSGRTLVEAAMAGVVLYAPLADRTLPTLVTERNRKALAARNFSARSRIAPSLVSSESELVKAFALGQDDGATALAREMRIDAKVIERYATLYALEQYADRGRLDRLLNWASFVVPHLRMKIAAKRN
ncbi:hypothetical protein ACTU6V_06280 [Microbacterium sp. A204]|uniref:hypothetical protein n=1 Tax=Microbacterium sp. A204 TaxID=3457321 RepID=UPI003FCFD396